MRPPGWMSRLLTPTRALSLSRGRRCIACGLYARCQEQPARGVSPEGALTSERQQIYPSRARAAVIVSNRPRPVHSMTEAPR